jgi:acyl dehydratase/GNAT superfamily N-acetyltransferase
MTKLQALVHSPLDSQRFGLRIFRGTVDTVDDRALFADIVGNAMDVAIVRTPAGAGGNLQRLGRYGMHPIHADTLVYYQVGLAEYTPKALRNVDLVFSEALPSDATELEALVARTFDGYRSHYHANPLLDREQILAGYAQWASGYLSPDQGGRVTWIARRGGKLVAYACCSHNREANECEGILYGVHPDSAGGGLYGDLIRYTQARYRERGYGLMKVSTQIWNLAVQKVWNREGFVLSSAYDTFHVNACLASGDLRVERELVFSPEQVARFAEVTGDVNPIHLDDAAAMQAGFASRISHGMLAGGELSRIFGTEIPGPGTLFLRSELVFIAPIHAGHPHVLRVRFTLPIPESGRITAVATVHDASGRLCMLCYNDLLRRAPSGRMGTIQP